MVICNMKGKIIYLNGTSSAGKTTLASELITVLPEKYLYLSLDNYNHEVGKMFVSLLALDPEVMKNDLAQGKKLLHKPILELMYNTIKVVSELGMNVIVDDVLNNKFWLEKCCVLLQDHPLFFVKVFCPLEELERRETHRGNRTIGKASRQLETIHQHDKYDIEVDTYINTSSECADQIYEAIYINKLEPKAFKEIYLQADGNFGGIA